MSTSAARRPAVRGERRVAPRTRVLGLEPVELASLVGLIGVALAVLVPLATRGRPLSGSDGLYPADQLQYFAWIREAGEHGLIGNRFDLAPGARTFLHPGFLLSGLLHRATGLSIPASYLLLWKPVAIAVTFIGCRAYVRRLLPAGAHRDVGLVIALFAVMPACALVAWTGWGGGQRQYTFDFISGEMWTGQYLWGYLMTAIAVFLVPLVLLAVERWRAAGARGVPWLATAGALVVGWLQPWQGATLAAIVVAVEAWRWWRARHAGGEPVAEAEDDARPAERPPLGLLVVLAAIALPALYYLLLGRLDDSWRLAGHSNAAGAQPEWSWPWWAVALTIAPLAAPAALAYRLPARTWQEQAVRVWPFAALAVYLAPGVTFPYHAFQGLTLPLAILAVLGVARFVPRLRGWWVAAALVVLIVPGFAHKLQIAATNVHDGVEPYFILRDEHRALAAIERDPRPGGVLAPLRAGQYTPYTTGREVYVGALSWAPDFRARRLAANALFAGQLSPARARAVVRASRARFLYADCGNRYDLTPVLGVELERVERFGCAAVYVLRERPAMLRAVGAPAR